MATVSLLSASWCNFSFSKAFCFASACTCETLEVLARCIRAVAIHGRTLGGSHGRCSCCLRSWHILRGLELLHLGGKLLSTLLILGISLRFRRLLRLKAGDLLRICSSRTHRQNALCGAVLFLPLTRLDMFASPMRPTITTSAMMTGVLFFTGPTASRCAGTVAGGLGF